jgi:hypothetical protein
VRQCLPCGALDYKRERDRVFRAIHNPKRPSSPLLHQPSAGHLPALWQTFNEAAPFTAGMLKSLGFDKVFDFTFAAD